MISTTTYLSVSHPGALGFKFKPIEEMPDDFIVSLVEQGRLSSFSLAINLSRHDILIFVTKSWTELQIQFKSFIQKNKIRNNFSFIFLKFFLSADSIVNFKFEG